MQGLSSYIRQNYRRTSSPLSPSLSLSADPICNFFLDSSASRSFYLKTNNTYTRYNKEEMTFLEAISQSRATHFSSLAKDKRSRTADSSTFGSEVLSSLEPAIDGCRDHPAFLCNTNTPRVYAPFDRNFSLSYISSRPIHFSRLVSRESTRKVELK